MLDVPCHDGWSISPVFEFIHKSIHLNERQHRFHRFFQPRLRSGSFQDAKVSWLAADMRGWRENMEDAVRMSGAGHPFRMPKFEERILTFQWYSTFIAGSEQLSQFCKQASQSVAATSCQGDCFCPACIRFTIKGCAMVLTLWVFHGRRNGNRVSWLPLYICLAFLVLLLKTPSCAFGRPKQQSASEVRERTGHDSRVKVRDSLENPLLPLSNQEKQLLRRISSASERRNWWEVQSCFSKNPGKGNTNLWCCHECCTEMP